MQIKMESAPLHLCNVNNPSAVVNRSYSLLHSIAITGIIYYRFSSLHNPISIPHLLVFASQLLLSLLWLLNQAYLWRPVSRTTFPENFQENNKNLPAIGVLVCTADPEREPPVEVMNTVLSAMALDYPPHKLSVYLSDDWGSAVTLHGTRQAWLFAWSWFPVATMIMALVMMTMLIFKELNSLKEEIDNVKVCLFQ